MAALAWLVPVGVGFVLCSCATPSRAPGPTVRELTIEGAKAVPAGDIKARLLTSEPGFWPWSERPRFEEAAWRMDLRRIERLYEARGYHSAKVQSAEVIPAGRGEVRLLARVQEGPPTRVVQREISGGGALSASLERALSDALGLRKGGVFLEQRWVSAKEELESLLRSRGYAEATASLRAEVDRDDAEAALHVELQPGPRYRFGEVRASVLPGARVERWRVLEQARLALADERWYSDEALREVQDRLFGMGVFGAVRASAGEGDPATGLIPVNVQVQEAPFQSIEAGVGIGLEPARDDAHVLARYTHRDFLGGLRRLELEALIGWAVLLDSGGLASGLSGIVDHGPIAQSFAQLTQPRLLSPTLTGDVRVEVERGLEPAFSFLGGRSHAKLTWRPMPWLALSPSYNVEVYQLDTGVTSLTTDAPLLLFGCPQTCVLSYVEQLFEVDKRDDPLEPRSGFYAAVGLQAGGGPLGGSFDYWRWLADVRGYQSMLPERRLTLAARLRLGALRPLSGGDSPIVARFFSGGDGMRGFSARRLAPQQLIEREGARGPYIDSVPVGGNSLIEASAEVRYALTSKLSVATFADTGLVRVEPLPRVRPFDDLLVAVGAGARYRLPVGVARLDLAYRLPTGPPLQLFEVPGAAGAEDLAPRGCFGLGARSPTSGGWPEGVCSVHLSIGEAF